MKSTELGLTSLYNELHDPENTSPEIHAIRDTHSEIDRAISKVYGWDDLDLGHSFHAVPYLPEKDHIRFTISEPARIEVLRRLAELNRQRYEKEVAQGLHGKTSSKGSTRKLGTRAPAKQTKATNTQQTGLDLGTSSAHSSYTVDGEPAKAILGYLRAHPGWHAKGDVLASVDFPAAQWSATISDLVDRGLVERKGQKRGTRYRIAQARSDA